MLQLSLILVFILIYMSTTGPCAWAYSAETCCDVGLSAVVFTLYFWSLILNFTTNSLLTWSQLFTFSMFGIITAISVVFIYFYVGETKGLNEKEKKELFMPGATYGRKLFPGEKPPAELGQEHKSRATIKSEMLMAGSADFADPK